MLLAVLATALPAFTEVDAATVAFFDVAFLGADGAEALALAGRLDGDLAAGVVR